MLRLVCPKLVMFPDSEFCFAYIAIVKATERSQRHCLMVDQYYLAYRTGPSVDLTVIGNPVFTLSRDLSFPYHVIIGTMGP